MRPVIMLDVSGSDWWQLMTVTLPQDTTPVYRRLTFPTEPPGAGLQQSTWAAGAGEVFARYSTTNKCTRLSLLSGGNPVRQYVGYTANLGSLTSKGIPTEKHGSTCSQVGTRSDSMSGTQLTWAPSPPKVSHQKNTATPAVRREPGLTVCRVHS